MKSGVPGARLDFALCAEPEADAAARVAVGDAIRILHEEAGALAFEAVILTGSLSRAEGSVLLEGASRRMLGDVEFIVVVKPPFHYPKLRRDMRRLSARATSLVRELGYEASIEYSPVGRRYLDRNIRPSIFAFDLTATGRTVVGDASLLDSVPRFDRSEIPREDSVRLVMNRMMELHALRLASPPDPLQSAYQATKTVLDLAGSVLAFEGSYVSSYGGRPAALRALGSSHPLAERLGELERAVELKLRPDREGLLRTGPDLEEILERAMDVWRWEMGRLVGGRNLRELLRGFLASEALFQTLRGWVKYYTHPLRPAGASMPLSRRLRLLFVASPHRLTYASALLAYQGERSCSRFREDAARLLPGGGADQPLSGAIELWQWLVRNN